MIRLRRPPAQTKTPTATSTSAPTPVPEAPTPTPTSDCPVCLSAPLQRKLDCGHEFCTACYDRLAPGSTGDWSLLPLCPLCRTPHLSVHPIVPADEAQVALNSVRSIRLSESTLTQLGKASGAYLGQLISQLEDTKIRIDEATSLLTHINRFSQPASAAPHTFPLPAISAFPLIPLPVFPLIPDAYWSGGGFLFQHLESSPQVVNSAHVTENILRRAESPELAHLNDGMLSLYRFGLLSPAGVGTLLHSAAPPAVEHVSRLLVWYLTQGFNTAYVDEFTADMEVIAPFYSNPANSRAWFVESTEGALLNELNTLYTTACVRHLDALKLRRTASREAHNAYFDRYNVLWKYLPDESRKCAGCEKYAPSCFFYSARRGTEPRRVRCEGCSPRFSLLQAWT